MLNSLIAVIFLMAVVTICFLGFQVHAHQCEAREYKMSHQDQLTKIARMLYQSSSTNDYEVSYDMIVRAHQMMEELMQSYGGTTGVENKLNMKTGEISELWQKIQDQYYFVQQQLRSYLEAKEVLPTVHPVIGSVARMTAPVTPEQPTSAESTEESEPTRKSKHRNRRRHDRDH